MVLGPILFLIYINDLPDKTRSNIMLFADDTAIYLGVSNLQDAQILQQDLDRLHEWELKWDMEFHPSNCVVIHITQTRTPSLVSTCCTDRSLIQLEAPSTRAWKSAKTFHLKITSRRYPHQQDGHLDSSSATLGQNPQLSVKWHTRHWCAH